MGIFRDELVPSGDTAILLKISGVMAG